MTAIGRQQWTGFNGAPSTQTFSIHSPIVSDRVGVGFLLMRDQIAITQQYNATASYAYRIPMEHGKLSMGLQAGISNFREDYRELGIDDDNVFNQGAVNYWQPNFGAGLYYYTKRFYAGFSVPQLLERTYDVREMGPGKSLVRHYFVHTGYVVDLTEDLKLKPSSPAR